MTMSSGTQREYDNTKNVDFCTACVRQNGLPCSPCSGFIDLEAKIVQTEFLLKDLIAQQNKMRTKINTSHDPMIGRLPIEISTHIMELSLPPSWSTSAENQPSKAELYTVLNISAVCRTWRQIAMGTPFLWKTIPVFIAEKYERHGTTVKFVEQWLQRAGDHPLSLRVHANCGVYYKPPSDSAPGRDQSGKNDNDNALASLVALINGQSYRWQNLELVVPNKLVSIFNGTLDGAPILERLRFRPSHEDIIYEWPEGIFSLKSPTKPAPSVVDISWLERIDIRWDNVTTTEWNRFSLKKCLVLFREATGLVDCTVKHILNFEDELMLAGESPTICPSLQSLTFSGIGRLLMAEFWNLLILPQLRTLEITSRQTPYRQIMNMLDRSRCGLTSLFLEYSHCEPGDAEQLFELLRQTTHLTELYLVKDNTLIYAPKLYHDVNPVCQFLNGGASPSALGNTLTEASQDGVKELVLPNLKFLAMDNVPVRGGPEVQWSGVADLFDDQATSYDSLARPHHRRPLTTLRISFSPDYTQDTPPPFYIDDESIQRFSDIIESGISLEFLVPHPLVPPCRLVDLIARSIEHSLISPREPVVPVEEGGTEEQVNEGNNAS